MDSRRDRHLGPRCLLGDALAGAPGPTAQWQVREMSETCDQCGDAGWSRESTCHTDTDRHVGSVHDPARLPVHDPGHQLA
jgi:hypothetical protein